MHLIEREKLLQQHNNAQSRIITKHLETVYEIHVFIYELKLVL
jgi:hypothetical protein